MAPDRIARSGAVRALAPGQMPGSACLRCLFAAIVVAWHRDLGRDKAVLAPVPGALVLLRGRHTDVTEAG